MKIIIPTIGARGDVQPVKQVQTLDGYRAVVVGAPLCMSDWLKEARNFLSRLVKILDQMFTQRGTNANQGLILLCHDSAGG